MPLMTPASGVGPDERARDPEWHKRERRDHRGSKGDGQFQVGHSCLGISENEIGSDYGVAPGKLPALRRLLFRTGWLAVSLQVQPGSKNFPRSPFMRCLALLA